MNNLEAVAAQRDELSMKLRAMALELDAANAEIAWLKALHGDGINAPQKIDFKDGVLTIAPIPDLGGYVEPVSLGQPGVVHGEVPSAATPKSKRSGIFGSK